MAYYDRAKAHRSTAAEKYLKTLEGKEAGYLKEWISNKDSRIAKLEKEIEEMREVFNGIAKYTNKRTLIMGN